MKKSKENYKTPRNEFHFYLKRVIKFNIHKTKKKELPRKRKHKGHQYDGFYYVKLVYN